MNTGFALSPAVPDGGDGPTAARRRLLADHRDTLAGVIDAADRVAADWTEPATDSTAVTDPLATELRRRSLLEPLLSALSGAADAVGGGLPHEPAAAPPYLTVTSRGPVLRATLETGRLVVVVGTFAVERASSDDVRYVRAGETPESVLTVELHRDGDRVVAGPDGTGENGGGDGGERA